MTTAGGAGATAAACCDDSGGGAVVGDVVRHDDTIANTQANPNADELRSSTDARTLSRACSAAKRLRVRVRALVGDLHAFYGRQRSGWHTDHTSRYTRFFVPAAAHTRSTIGFAASVATNFRSL